MTHSVPSASKVIQQLQSGSLTSVELVQACLNRIQEREPLVGAWEYLEAPDTLLDQAKRCDELLSKGTADKPLLGLPVGVKDIFATKEMPTGWGTPIHSGRYFDYDAAIVEQIKAAGAIIVGKTVTTEYAAARAGKTRNPHELDHTPGGSSSGSAAAVADGMVPIAIGSQTVGSILRPAAFCGVVGFKPSFGRISRYGMLPCSRNLDHVGLFAQTVSDIACLYPALSHWDVRDPDCYGQNSGTTIAQVSALANPPTLALVRGPYWSRVDESARTALLNSAIALSNAGAVVTEITLPSRFDQYFDDVTLLASVDMSTNHSTDYAYHGDQMSPALRQMIELGRQQTAVDYAKARQNVVDYSIALYELFDTIDAVLAPVTTGIAPNTLTDTGSPIFCGLASLCGLPAVNLPVTKVDGLPLGIQLMASRGDDYKLLAIANWAENILNYSSLV